MQVWMSWPQVAQLWDVTVEQAMRLAVARGHRVGRSGVQLGPERLAEAQRAVKAREYPLSTRRAA